ncbi:MAG: MFS transporter [Syntrophomonas sp.]|nr:MFS transporter [Syntrophomonas sp.]
MEKETQYTADLRGARRNILIMAFGLLLVIMSFTGFVNYMTFAQNYNNSLVSTYSVAGNEIARKIEYALHYGKPINNFYGMHETLNELKEVIDEVEQVKIVTTQGEVLYDLNGFVRDTKLPDELMEAAMFQQGTVNEKPSYQFYEEAAHVFIRINDSHGEHIANLVMVFPHDDFMQINSPFTMRLAAYLMGIALIVLILLAFIFFKTQFIFHDKSINKKRILIAFIILLGSAQLVYSGINYMLFKNAYIEMADTSKTFIQNIVAKNINSIYDKGLSLQNVTGVDEYIDSIKESLPQIQDLHLIPTEENGLPLTKVNATVSNTYIEQQMFKTLLDMLTVLVISILFMIELTLLAVTLMTRGPTNTSQMSGEAAIRASHGLVRSLTYFVNMGACMSLTFVPIVMKDYYEPLLGLPQDVVLGLPLSAEMLGGILAIILAGWAINRQGWRTIIYWGAALLAVGNLLSGLSVSALPFILSRGIAGLGLGFILMSIRSLVVSLPKNNLAIAEYSAGSLAGLNCGLVIGGMLADRIGYAAIFYIAAIMVIIPSIFVLRLMTEFEIAQREPNDSSIMEKLIKFIAYKKTVLFLICIFIPYFISCAFLDYYFPLFSSSNELSQSDISRGFLLNGLVIIYMGPVLTKYIANKLSSTQGLIMSMAFVIFALTNFILFGTIEAAFATIIILGIAESFGVSLKTTYFLNLKGIRELEINKGIAMFSIMVNGSRMAGPIIFGVALTLGMRMGVGLISLLMLILLLVFIYSTRFDPAQKKISESA